MQRMHHRPPAFVGRSDLETLLASDNAADWCVGWRGWRVVGQFGRGRVCGKRGLMAWHGMTPNLLSACRVAISEMLLGPAPAGFVFSPKHKANSYAKRPAAADLPAGAAPSGGGAASSGGEVEEEEY